LIRWDLTVKEESAMKNGIRTLTAFAMVLLLAVGCASSRSGKVYSRDQARQTQTVYLGTVERVEWVQIEGTKTPLGVIAGAAVGGVLGSSIGHGWGSVIAGTAGAVAGGMAGAAVEEEVTKKDGIEITVTLDSGETIAIVQEADEAFRVGDRVRILTGPDGTARVRY
jgi:outer membrane lipoprotein SlyB